MLSASSPTRTSHAEIVSLYVQIQFFFLLSLALITAGCGAVGNNVSTAAHSAIQQNAISLSPDTTTMISGARQQFTATVTNASNPGVIWSASAGSVTDTGLFIAPVVTLPTRVVITATGYSGRGTVGTATVTVTSTANLSIAKQSLPLVTSGSPYAAGLAVSGGSAPYHWSVGSGSLPKGLSLDRASGLISGTTTQSGSFPFTAVVSDAGSHTANQSFTLSVSATLSGNFDGPAELPRIYIQSSMASTPAPGSVTMVSAGADLQAALNNATCGETIELQAGATFTGVFTFPAKSCDDNHWIIVRTSSLESSLPPEGTRITPCYAGVSSLPGRPSFHCKGTANVMAKLVMGSTSGSGPIQFASGANHYRLIGLEITRPKGGSVIYNLASPVSGAAADHLIFDRVWMHGTAQDETNRGILLGGSTYVSIVDSFFTDFHCISITGACGDAQAVGGGDGSNAMGPYQIVNNFLEASAQSILLGGGTATQTPVDIEIRRNHMFKPLTWLKGQSGYVGGADGNPFIVKNLFELKNAQRVLFEGNILEYSWGGFSQTGFGILLTPKNQAVGTGNGCPTCQVTDVTIRYTTISHVASGMQIGNGLSDNGGVALAGERYSIHDVIIDDVNPTKFNGAGTFAQVSMGDGSPVLQDVTINHVTAFAPSIMLNIGDSTTINGPMNQFVFANNIVNAGAPPLQSTGGGTVNCAYYNSPLTTLNACFSSYTFAANAVIACSSKFPSTTWPSGNYFPGDTTSVQFVNYNNGNGGDYHLLPSSPFKNAGTDGKDLGADIDAVSQTTSGVL